jgi:hypothetical protein
MPGKRVQFDEDTWNALDLLARDRMQDFQELADEAFGDLLRKHAPTTRHCGRVWGERETRLAVRKCDCGCDYPLQAPNPFARYGDPRITYQEKSVPDARACRQLM